MEMKIGQEIQVKKPHSIVTYDTEETLNIKIGDKGFVDAHGFVHYTTGEAAGIMAEIDDAQLIGIDTLNIVKMVMEKLDKDFDIKKVLQAAGVDRAEFEDSIFGSLNEVLKG